MKQFKPSDKVPDIAFAMLMGHALESETTMQGELADLKVEIMSYLDPDRKFNNEKMLAVGPNPILLTPEYPNAQQLFDEAKAWIEARGFKVVIGPGQCAGRVDGESAYGHDVRLPGGGTGLIYGETCSRHQEISLSNVMTISQQFRVLVHEIGHALAGLEATQEYIDKMAARWLLEQSMGMRGLDNEETAAELLSWLALRDLGLKNPYTAHAMLSHGFAEATIADQYPRVRRWADELKGAFAERKAA
jgi:hypothetical protein